MLNKDQIDKIFNYRFDLNDEERLHYDTRYFEAIFKSIEYQIDINDPNYFKALTQAINNLS